MARRQLRHINDLLHQPDLETIAARFWRKVGRRRPGGCKVWGGATDPAGYGIFTVGDSVFKAHRVAWVLTKGPIPTMPDGRTMRVCHSCDDTRCMHSELHHFLGTDLDNVKDMLAKERQVRGVEHYEAKLDPEAVRHIRRTSIRTSELAKLYRVTPGAIYAVRSGRTWKHVKA